MGYMRHHAIVVTGWSEHQVQVARQMARYYGCDTTEIVASPVNSYFSFMVIPDGSKEGWDHSNEGNESRAKFVSWLRSVGGANWVEVQYGDEGGDNRIINCDADGPNDAVPFSP